MQPTTCATGWRTALLAGALLATFAAFEAGALPPAERVHFESLDRNDSGLVTIEGLLYRPEGGDASARPAVIALHGCGGLYSGVPGREAQLSARHAAHAERLLANGYVVLFPDSLGPRGLREMCTLRSGERPVNPARRRLDALGALAWLARQPGVSRDRIALIGWSHGGSTVLSTVNAARGEFASPFLRGAIAFYPGCAPALRDPKWKPAVPTRIVIGSADDWTPAEPCERLAARAREFGWPLETTVVCGRTSWLRCSTRQDRASKGRAERREPGAGRARRA